MQVVVFGKQQQILFSYTGNVSESAIPDTATEVIAVRAALTDALEHLDEMTGRTGRTEV